MEDRRSSAQLISTGDHPPDDGQDILGTGCGTDAEGRPLPPHRHVACSGWWPSDGGFTCKCPCHAAGNGWPGWDRHLASGGNDV